MRSVPAPVAPAPFVPATQEVPSAIEFRPDSAISPADHLILANAESSIAEHAARGGIDFSGGGWSYEQIVCPVLPNHLFLQYRRAAGTGSETAFSASVPRGAEGRVRIIPIRRRGYSLFSPAPVNALTISAFNHIRAEEPEPQRAKGWLGNALCYAALAGARPQLPPASDEALPGHPVPALGAFLHVKNREGEVIQFSDAAAAPHPMLWTMSFTREGKLIKATHSLAPLVSARPVPKTEPAKFKPVPIETPTRASAVPPAR